MRPGIGLVSSLAAGLAVVTGPLAWAQNEATATAHASASISSPAAIAVTQKLSFTVHALAANTGLTVTSSAANGTNAVNVVLTGGQTTSISVPATFEVTRAGGRETITVRTVRRGSTIASLDGATQVLGTAGGDGFDAPVSVIGALDNGVLSFSVAGQVAQAGALAPGEYQGVLTVIAQYN